jgi:predicted nucleic acid-binding protein
MHHRSRCTTLLPDEGTCVCWAYILADSRAAGRPITAADAWVAARALQWDLALVTADYHSFEHLDGLTLIPVLP